MIPVTKPFLPPIEEYQKYLEGIWEREYLTNNGPLLQEFEQKVRQYLDVKHLVYMSNGTTALQIAIKALGLKGEIITTPFSYIATTSTIVWEGCKPVFVDIHPKTLTIDPALIEGAITGNTTGILATHVFGNPCDIDAIQKIADKHNLKVIYDAAHSFGTKYRNRSVFEFGDISIVSFHATKLFHTVEGGAAFTANKALFRRMRFMRNFGHAGPGNFNGVGINGKNSELHAAMGLCNLKYIEKILNNRKKQCELYDELLDVADIQKITTQKYSEVNYAYYPVIFRSEALMLHVKTELEKNDIYTRRYFYPSLEKLDYVESKEAINSRDISARILCLPTYFDLEREQQKMIASLLIEKMNLSKRLEFQGESNEE